MAQSRLGIQDRDFPTEFAEFVGYVGPEQIKKALRRVEHKLKSLSGPVKSLYGERFFFHRQIDLFTEQNFQLDVNDFFAVRAATLVAVTNFVRRKLSEQGAKHLRSMIIDNLKPDRDVRQIEHELRCFTHISQLDLDVDFSDLENQGGDSNFDLIVRTPDGEIEVECKTINHNAGSQIKEELNVNLVKTFEAHIDRRKNESVCGLFVYQLHRPVSDCTHLPEQFNRAFRSAALPYHCEDFSLTFEEKPEWLTAIDANDTVTLERLIGADISNDLNYVIQLDHRMIAIVFRPHAPCTLDENVVKLIHKASAQCSGKRPAVVWVHFLGLSQAAFKAIAEFSMSGNGDGLNRIVSHGIFEDAPPETRHHIERVRFTADSDQLVGRQVKGPDGHLVNAVAVTGLTYDVPNHRRKFSEIAKI